MALVDQQDRVKATEDGNLFQFSLKRTDSNNYRCRENNGGTYTYSESVNVIVACKKFLFVCKFKIIQIKI